ncbi:MAG: extracellular solute-binding protein, partial [Victivallales bacterium]|nr:extracellular solute-binding protein [Victivallales bacterium]
MSYSILLLLLACRLQGGKVESRDVVEESGVRVRKTVVTVVAWSLPDPTRTDTNTRAQVAVMKEFVKQYPQIVQKKYRARYEADPDKYGKFDWGNVMVELVPRSGIQVEGTGQDSGPLMAIAGGVAPDIMYVNFRQSDTYIQEGFLYPLDKAEDGYFTGMDDDERSFIYHEKVMPVVRRKGPGGEHVWAMPTGGLLGKVFLYRNDLLAKYGVAEPKPDWTWEDLFDACRKITHPAEGTYGIRFGKGKDESWYWVTFLWSAGGDVMAYDAEKDEWTATFDSDEAVTALDFYVRLTSEHWRDPLDGRDRFGYATKETDSDQKWELGQIGFFPTYIDARLFATIDPDTVGMVPVPLGYPDKNGVRHRGGELNSRMQGIFAGCDNPVVRDAAWEYMRFCESKEGVEIYTRVMVEGGLGRFINPDYLRQFGYEDMIRLAPAGWEDTFKIAIDTGMPEP